MASATVLHKRHSKAELLEQMQAIEADPANKNPDGEVFRFNAAARKRLDAIAQAITFHLADEREAAGKPVPCDGYSGRQTNRRR